MVFHLVNDLTHLRQLPAQGRGGGRQRLPGLPQDARRTEGPVKKNGKRAEEERKCHYRVEQEIGARFWDIIAYMVHGWSLVTKLSIFNIAHSLEFMWSTRQYG